MRRKISSLLLTVALMLGIGVAFAQPAAAGPTVYNISVTVTGMQCPGGGTVSRVNVHILTPGTSGSSWNSDTVSGLSAFSGQNDQIIGSNFCKTTWYGAGYYYYWSVYRYISYAGQHTYV